MDKAVTLPSGAKLEITLSPVEISYELFSVISEELKTLKMHGTQEIDYNLIKDMLLTGICSKKIKAAVKECMKRALYDGVRIDDQTFEPKEKRQDLLVVMYEVAVENIAPFTKSLSALFVDMFQEVKRSIHA